MITEFLSNKVNLMVLQGICLFLIGYIMGSHLGWVEFVIMYLVILLLQFLTHIRAVAHGMMYNEIMNKDKDFKKFLKDMKKNKSGDK